MILERISAMKEEFALVAILLASFLFSVHPLAGRARGSEVYSVKASLEPEVFQFDEYAMCLASSVNHIQRWIVRQTTESSRRILYYLVFFMTLWLLAKISYSIV